MEEGRYMLNMDSQESNNFSCSQQSFNNTIPPQFSNQFNPLNLPFQPIYQFDPKTGSYPSHVNQQYDSRIPYQNLWNTYSTPIGSSRTLGVPKGPKHKASDIDKPNNSQSSSAIKNWSKEEDIALTKAWLYISMDSDVGNGQRNIAL
ncbi:uncharacterized protein Fot_55807 [Forsythia ovata]|uniref:Uncharacterized protein n=1 Tax=Forsythia ovata TaxID=205694 RepID=A0ABD1P391_9LAMI